MTKLCTYTDCQRPATRRADYPPDLKWSWPKPVLRCEQHLGHHDFTHRWIDGEWREVQGG